MTRVGRSFRGSPSPGAFPPGEEDFYPGHALLQAVGGQQPGQAVLPGNIGERDAKSLGRGLKARQVFPKEPDAPRIGPEGLKKPVAVEKAPVIHRHPGLGQGQQFIVEPDEFGLSFG